MDREFDKYLEILEKIFTRLKNYSEQEGGGEKVKQFLDGVWDLHKNGK